MQVLVVLDTPDRVFANLDFVKGRVILRMPSPSSISTITVKLEGESTTQLMVVPPGRDGERPRPVQELHKVLYHTETVFNGTSHPLNGKTSYTMAPGSYEYPFTFKIPFNNTCHSASNINFASLPNLLKGSNTVSSGHIKSPLPPTLGGFPGLASIRYFVKATVKRKEFFKENPRAMQYITFLPIEPPRPPPSNSENFGRRAYEFMNIPIPPVAQSGLKGIFGLKVKSSTPLVSNPTESPHIEVEARLPDPAILTSNQPIPLRLMLRRRDPGNLTVWLQTLHIELVGHTKIRAGTSFRDEVSIWPITSHSNMNQLLKFSDPETSPSTPSTPTTPIASRAGSKGAPEGSPSGSGAPNTPTRPTCRNAQIILDPTPWSTPLPPNVAPSFDTCNIKRSYQLEARLGVGVGAPATSQKNQVILPLRLNCDVYSGITPPQALLDAAAASGRARPALKRPVSTQTGQNAAAPQMRPQVSQVRPHAPQQQQQQAGPARPPRGPYAPLPAGDDQGVEEPPPSYEDAMAQELGPVDGPRAYRPAAAPEGGDGFAREGKRRGS